MGKTPADKNLKEKLKKTEKALQEHKLAEKTLHKTIEKYRLITEGTSDLIATTTFSLNPKYTYVSPSHKKLMGYDPDDLLGQPGFSFMAAEDRKKLLPILKKYIGMKAKGLLPGWRDMEDSLTIEFRAPDKQGNLHDLQSTVDMIGNEILFISRDVTERKQAERALKDSEHTFRTIIDNAPIGIYYSDFAGTFLYGNAIAEKVSGFSVEELLGKNFLQLELLSPNEIGRAAKLLAKNAFGKPTGPDEFLLRRKDGSKVNAEINTVVTKIGGKRVVLGMVQDITQRKQSEQALHRYADRLKASNEELQQFAYVASHDLSEPLRMVVSYIELLKRRYGKSFDDKALDFIGFALDGATRLQRLLDDLLTYSRLGTQGKPHNFVDMNVILKQSLQNLKVSIDENNAEVTCDPLPRIMGEETQLLQLFQNLIVNAIKFQTQNRPEVHVKADLRDGEWLFSICDNGIGIEEKERECIFHIFSRLHTQDEFPGSGMGLAICKRTVERHGGRIWAEKNRRRGTTFFLPFQR